MTCKRALFSCAVVLCLTPIVILDLSAQSPDQLADQLAVGQKELGDQAAKISLLVGQSPLKQTSPSQLTFTYTGWGAVGHAAKRSGGAIQKLFLAYADYFGSYVRIESETGYCEIGVGKLEKYKMTPLEFISAVQKGGVDVDCKIWQVRNFMKNEDDSYERPSVLGYAAEDLGLEFRSEDLAKTGPGF